MKWLTLRIQYRFKPPRLCLSFAQVSHLMAPVTNKLLSVLNCGILETDPGQNLSSDWLLQLISLVLTYYGILKVCFDHRLYKLGFDRPKDWISMLKSYACFNFITQ